jgi:hypothetical protein
VGDTTLGTTLGNPGFDKTTFPNPVFIGDTIRASSKVVDKRPSATKADRGIVTFEHLGTNQRGEVVCSCVRGAMMMRRAVSDARQRDERAVSDARQRDERAISDARQRDERAVSDARQRDEEAT